MIVWCSGGGEAGTRREGGAAALEVHPHRWQEDPATVIDAPLPPLTSCIVGMQRSSWLCGGRVSAAVVLECKQTPPHPPRLHRDVSLILLSASLSLPDKWLNVYFWSRHPSCLEIRLYFR